MTRPVWSYPSISAAARAHGIHIQVLHARLQRAAEDGVTLHEDDACHVEKRQKRAVRVECFGYPSITQAAEAMGLPINVVAWRHRQGWPKAQASWARRRTPRQWARLERDIAALLDSRRAA